MSLVAFLRSRSTSQQLMLIAGSAAAIGSLALLFSSVSGADIGTLWSLLITMMIVYSAASAIAALFSPRWKSAILSAFLGYLLLGAYLVALLVMSRRDSFQEIAEYPEMYAAFFLSFFFIHGVAGGVRAIAHFLELRS